MTIAAAMIEGNKVKYEDQNADESSEGNKWWRQGNLNQGNFTLLSERKSGTTSRTVGMPMSGSVNVS